MTTTHREGERIQRVKSLQFLRTDPIQTFNHIAKVAAEHFKVPIALVSIVDEHEQWFAGRTGLAVEATPRDQAFCAHAIQSSEPFIVEDATQDPRFAANPLVTHSPHIRFYAGAPLTLPDGFRLGTVCIIDRQPRTLNIGQRIVLANLAKIATDELVAIRHNHEGGHAATAA